MELYETDLFDGISKDECEAMQTCFQVRRRFFRTGQTICDYGKGENNIGIVLSGNAVLLRFDADGNKTVLEYYAPNSVFGESIAFSSTAGDSIFVSCLTDCEIVFIEYSHIVKRCEKACRYHSQLVCNMFRLMSNKSIQLSERVEILSNRTIRGKLTCYFNLEAGRQKGNPFTIPGSLSGLADYLCVDRSAMMREIANMKSEKMIDINKRNVRLL